MDVNKNKSLEDVFLLVFDYFDISVICLFSADLYSNNKSAFGTYFSNWMLIRFLRIKIPVKHFPVVLLVCKNL